MVGRLFNTVGPRQTGRYGMVVPNFVRQALAGQPITVFGDGSQRRCFCHVKDVVSALIGLMADERAHGEVFNVGSTEEVTMLELAGRVRDAAGSDSEIVTVPYEEAYGDGFEDMQRRIPDTTQGRGAAGMELDPRPGGHPARRGRSAAGDGQLRRVGSRRCIGHA